MNQPDPMLELELCLWQLDLEKPQALEMLQDAGVISDNCITIRDIAHADIPKAMAYLWAQHDVGN